MLMNGYLQKRRNGYYARLAVPQDLRNYYGRGELIQSLKTSDQRVAKAKVLKVISDWKLGFEAARGNQDALATLAAEIRLAPDTKTDPNAPMSDKDAYLESIADSLPENKERRFRDIAMGRATPLTLYLNQYFEQWQAEPKTKDMAKTAIHRVAETIPFLEGVTRPLVVRLVASDTTSAATKSKNYGFVRQYWKYLQDIGAVSDQARNPFSELRHTSKKGQKKHKRDSFSAKEINQLIKAANASSDGQLVNLITIAAYTGARIEEICQLQVGSVNKVEGIDCFSIANAKTEAGNRVVPVHPELRTLIKRLVRESSDNYLLSELSETKYGDRSNAIGKRFGRLKTELGFGPEKVFHSIRKTVTTMLENAGVPEGVAADILGHEKATITYGVYSTGFSTKLKLDAIRHLAY